VTGFVLESTSREAERVLAHLAEVFGAEE